MPGWPLVVVFAQHSSYRTAFSIEIDRRLIFWEPDQWRQNTVLPCLRLFSLYDEASLGKSIREFEFRVLGQTMGLLELDPYGVHVLIATRRESYWGLSEPAGRRVHKKSRYGGAGKK